MLFSFLVITLIFRAICPCFYTPSILQVILPIAFILGPVLMSIHAITISFIIFPFAVKNVSINMPKFTLSMSLVFSPLAFITSTIRPYLNTVPISHFVEPLSFISKIGGIIIFHTFINSSIFKNILLFVLALTTLFDTNLAVLELLSSFIIKVSILNVEALEFKLFFTCRIFIT